MDRLLTANPQTKAHCSLKAIDLRFDPHIPLQPESRTPLPKNALQALNNTTFSPPTASALLLLRRRPLTHNTALPFSILSRRYGPHVRARQSGVRRVGGVGSRSRGSGCETRELLRCGAAVGVFAFVMLVGCFDGGNSATDNRHLMRFSRRHRS